jgi:hypothetical protein
MGARQLEVQQRRAGWRSGQHSEQRGNRRAGVPFHFKKSFLSVTVPRSITAREEAARTMKLAE